MAPPSTCCASGKWLNQAETNYKTPHIFERLWSLSNDDTNRNETGNNVIGLNWQNNNSARASRFFVHFSAIVARLQRETACSNFTFCRGREQETTTLLFFSWTLMQSFRYIGLNSKKKKIANIWRIKRDGMSAIKFEALRIHFLSQVFLAVAVIVAYINFLVSLSVRLQCCPPYNGSRRQPAYKGVDSQKSLCWRGTSD